MTINIRNFLGANGQRLNALINDNSDALINHIGTLQTDQEKINALFNCLSQTLALKESSKYGHTGMCESQLKSQIYKFAKQYPQETLNATNDDKFREEPNLSDTIAKVNKVIYQVMNNQVPYIDIQDFDDPNAGLQHLNAIKDSRYISNLINVINALTSLQRKIEELFSCLSQGLALQGSSQFEGESLSVLKNTIFTYAKTTAQTEILNIANDGRFKQNPALSEIIAQAIYLTKHRFISDSAHRYLGNTRFTHHLDKLLGRSDSATSTRAMAYLFPGLTLATLGLTQLFPATASEPIPNDRTLVIGIPSLSIGSFLIISPIIHAVRASGEENP